MKGFPLEAKKKKGGNKGKAVVKRKGTVPAQRG